MKVQILRFLSLVLLFSAVTMTAIAEDKEVKQDAVPVAQHYEGGKDKLLADIKSKVVYPMMAKRTRKQGTCIIKITLHADGSVSNYEVVKNIGAGCGQEALRVVKTLKFKAPGYDQDYKVPVLFSLK